MTVGIVIYCDAGARPTNPGYVGWGLHGYKYNLEESKKGTGLPDQVLTNKGYFLKSAFADAMANKITEEVLAAFTHEELQKITIAEPEIYPVTPIHYIDGYGNLSYTSTNNVGELTAAITALNWCKEHPEITHISIFADSEYVVKGTNEYLEKWKNNNWLKQDRTLIANDNLWKEHSALLEYYKEKGVKVTIDWVRAHNGEHGNEIADRYSTVAALKAMGGQYLNCVEVTQPEGYWKYIVDRHPFISHKAMIFNALTEYQVPGHYYLSDNVREIENVGKKSTDGAYAFIALTDPDDILELVRAHQSKLANGCDALIIARLDYLFNPTHHKEIGEFKTYAMYQKDLTRLDLYGLNREPITRELRPAKLSIRAVEALSDLSMRLDQYLQNDDRYICTDITDQFFEIKEVKKKKDVVEQFVLRPEITVGAASVKVNVNYNVKNELKDKKISLTLGVDLPSRNSIKQMEDLKPKIHLITWKESDQSFRYATVIFTDKDKGIWAGVYSNLIVIQD